MNKEEVALIIAQNGLGTAVTLLTAKAARLRKRAASANVSADVATKLNREATKAEKLATALRIANNGIAEYQAETSE